VPSSVVLRVMAVASSVGNTSDSHTAMGRFRNTSDPLRANPMRTRCGSDERGALWFLREVGTTTYARDLEALR
jgi:hypothetical protein